jgi:K+-sensing histidine kinase KdpD
VFERFERFERGVSPQSYGGFGIGLFLAKQIVVAHHGSLEAKATPGSGATLTMRLPRSAPKSRGALDPPRRRPPTPRRAPRRKSSPSPDISASR